MQRMLVNFILVSIKPTASGPAFCAIKILEASEAKILITFTTPEAPDFLRISLNESSFLLVELIKIS